MIACRSELDVILLILHAVTRSHKLNDRDHQGLIDGTADPEQRLPRYFAKAGFVDTDPKKTKKDGAGKANWQVERSANLASLTHP